MSGHNKWSKIKRAKGIKDKEKGNIFAKLARLVTLAVIEGGGVVNPDNNVKLRLAIEKAKSFNLPKENIQRAIERGVGPDKQQLKEIIYEAFGPGGVSFVILATTDNINRTFSEIRKAVELMGGKLGNHGSVLYIFIKCGLAVFNNDEVGEESVLNFADRIKAFDIDKDDEHFYIYFPYESLTKVKDFLQGMKYKIIEINYKPNSFVEVTDQKLAKKISEFAEAVENLDDVHKVYSNEKIT